MVRGGEATGEVTATGPARSSARPPNWSAPPAPPTGKSTRSWPWSRTCSSPTPPWSCSCVGYAHHVGMSLGYILPLLLTILLASIPVALPATFTLAAALGSVELSKRGVLITRLSALHDIASMTVLCSDKTGTLTRNQATVNTLWPAPGASEAGPVARRRPGQRPRRPGSRGWRHRQSRHATAVGRTAKWNELISSLSTQPPNAPKPCIAMAEVSRRFVKGAPAVVAKLTGAADVVWQSQAAASSDAGNACLASRQERRTNCASLVCWGWRTPCARIPSPSSAQFAKPASASSWSRATTPLPRAAWREQVGIPGDRMSAGEAPR